jgi:hypothetical protein
MTMINGRTKSKESIIAQMAGLGLRNMDGEFGEILNPYDALSTRRRESCDTCTLFSGTNLGRIPISCDQMGDKNCCRVCWATSRPSCSWTGAQWIASTKSKSQLMPEGSNSHAKCKTAFDAVQYQIVATNALVAQRRWVDTGIG